MKSKIIKIITITFVLLFAFFAIIIYWQFFSWSSYLELSENERMQYSMSVIDTEFHSEQSNDSLYSINVDELKTLISQSKTKYHVINFFKHYCVPPQYIIEEFEKLNFDEDYFTVYLITPEDWIYKQEILEYIKTIPKYKKYIINAYLYDIKHFIHNKINLFMTSLVDSHKDIDDYDFFILNQNMEIILIGGLDCINIEECEENMKILQQKLNSMLEE